MRVITNDFGIIEEESIEEIGDAWHIFRASLDTVDTHDVEYTIEGVA